MKYLFGNIVIVEEKLVGVVVKCCRESPNRPNHYEVYVRSLNGIQSYNEDLINHYIHHK